MILFIFPRIVKFERKSEGGGAGEATAKSALATKAWFSYVRKIPDDQGGQFLPTIPDTSDNRQKSVPDSREKPCLFVIGGAGAQQFRGLVMSEIHRRRSRRYKFEFSFVGNDRRPSQKSVKHRENRTLPILQICPRPSLTIGSILDFEFSLVGKIWDGLETVKSPIVWDFLDI